MPSEKLVVSDAIGLAVVGLPGAGKSTLLACAAKQKAACVEWSKVLAVDIEAATTDRTQAHMAAGDLVRSRGENYYPTKIFQTLNTSGATCHVVSGARNPRELDCLKRCYSRFRVVWVSANYLARFERCSRRMGLHGTNDLEDFLRKDMYELSHGLAEVFCTQVDDILFNDRSLDAFGNAADAYVASTLHMNGVVDD